MEKDAVERELKVLLILALTLVVTLAGKHLAAQTVFLPLTVMVVAAMFLTVRHLVLLTLVGIYILNWKPEVSAETVTLAILPLAAVGIDRILPGKKWVVALVASIVASLAMRFVVGDFSMPSLWLGSSEVAVNLIFAAFVFAVLNYWYAPQTTRFRR
jgi:hypothetical protein